MNKANPYRQSNN